MFFAKIRNSIIKKHQFHQYRFQSSYIRDFWDEKNLYIKFNENIHIELRRHCSSFALLSFINDNHEYLEIPKHVILKKHVNGDEPEFIKSEIYRGVDSFFLLWYRSYRLFWKDKLILKTEPRVELTETDKLDKLKSSTEF
ncbi:unnamed protein product [Rhizophagus irregularis]|nr:unnamed protein product [Rhizophagus irregularis]CAB5363785.1 unnamed protein product [Rhizophagus irregularis]